MSSVAEIEICHRAIVGGEMNGGESDPFKARSSRVIE
jgi:hypothetical protein